jgi:hypothetical protein
MAVPAQLAPPGGSPGFDAINVPDNTDFPAISSSLQATSTGLSPVATTQGATVRVVSTGGRYSEFQIVIPAVNVNFSGSIRTGLVAQGAGDAPTYGLSYVVLGEWSTYASATTPLQNATAFAFGYETTSAAMPNTGTAVFSGTATAQIYKPVDAEIHSNYATGNAALSVDFGSGKLTGAFTNMRYGTQPWNDVSVNGNIAAGTNKFSGSTAVTSAPGTPFSLSGSATGRIDGGFYGPKAENLGAIWSLSDGTGSVLGGVAAGR